MNCKKELETLKKYFQKENEVILAFLFGSHAEERARSFSDWDIGVYFKPKEYLELVSSCRYPKEEKIWSDLVEILKTDNIDFVVLNRASPDLVYKVLKDGIPLTIKDEKLYYDLLCKASYESIDWWQFVDEYWRIRENAKSLSPQAKAQVQKRLIFLEEQFQDFEYFKKLTFSVYSTDRKERRNVERWIENLVISAIDIAQIFLASDKKEIPQTYKEILKVFTTIYLNFPPESAEKFSDFVKLRNIITHEYLDIRWQKIKDFIDQGYFLYSQFIEKVKAKLL